jgi:TonB family protein
VRRHDDINVSQLQLRWSPNTFRGFGISMSVFAVFLLVSLCTRIAPPEPYRLPDSEGIKVLAWGYGDGTGGSHGNLTEEGRARKGPETSDLEDASSANSRRANPTDDPTQYALHRPVDDVGEKGNRTNQANANDRNKGSQEGDEDGFGKGLVGQGSGKGLGYGVDWGGGGNRVVLNKQLPKFPSGILNVDVVLKFRVRPDGTVSRVWPTRRGGDPAVDAAAVSAMLKWRFNALSNQTEMEGTITFKFRNS